MQGKQWNKISFTSGSLFNLNEAGTELLANLIHQQKGLEELVFKMTNAPEASMTTVLEAVLMSESILTIRELGVPGQRINDEGIFALLTITKHAKLFKPGQPDTNLTPVIIEKRQDQKFIYAFKNYGDEYFFSVPVLERQ